MDGRVYLDHAASSCLRPLAREALLEALDAVGNPSSIHAEGQRARHILDNSRRNVAENLGVRAERVVFTSGGSEANNMALRGVMAARPGRILVSAVEHDCVRKTAVALGGELIPVDGDGVLKLDILRAELAKGDVRLVSVMHANNETGVLQPFEEIADIAHSYGALVHTDAVQTVGHMDVKPDVLGADLLTLSGHKLGGARGAGALILKPELEMEPLITGGGQERNRRAGTENVAAIASLSAALTAALEPSEAARMRDLAGLFERLCAGHARAIAALSSEKIPHIRMVLVDEGSGSDTVMKLDLNGVAVSQGSACSSGRVKESHVLTAMGLRGDAGVRISWGWNTTASDIERAVALL